MAPVASPSVLDVLRTIARDPFHYLVLRWNWKSAVTSTLIRGSIFFAANLSVGFRAALAAMLADWSFRAILTGMTGAVTQSFRKAEPAWAATLAAAVMLPGFSHAIEFLVHWARHTPKLAASIVASVGFTVLSTLFNMYAMRQGVLVVDRDAKSLAHDMAAMPRIIAGFVACGPLLLWRAVQRRNMPLTLFGPPCA